MLYNRHWSVTQIRPIVVRQKQHNMKKIITSTIALLTLIVMSCEETIAPESTEELPKLLRLETTNDQTGETTVLNYSYENDLLTKISDGHTEYRYTYSSGAISVIELWCDTDLIMRYNYTVEGIDKIIVSQFVFDNGNETLIRVEEREDLGNSVLRYSFYAFQGGQKTLEYYVQKTVIGGNVTMEQSFNPDGSSKDKVSNWSFGEAINPLSYVSGSISGRNLNLPVSHRFIDEGTLTILQTHEIETNEFNLPTEIRSVLRNTFFGEKRITERYFYE